MNRLSFVILLIQLAPLSFGQLVITNEDMPQKNDTLRFSEATLPADFDLQETGANLFWDLSELIATRQDVLEYKSITGINLFYAAQIGFDKFGIQRIDSIDFGLIELKDPADFYNLNEEAFSRCGLGITIDDQVIGTEFSDPDEVYDLPMTYGDSTQSSFHVSAELLDGGVYAQYGTRTKVVDGFGTIVTPLDTFDCLRVKTEIDQNDSLMITRFFLPITLNTKLVTYQWLAKDERLPILEVAGNIINDTFTVNSIRYKDRFRADIADPLLPNVDFEADNPAIIPGSTVKFYDQSSNLPFNWEWNIIPAQGYEFVSGSTPHSQNPEVLFSAPGWYDVSLTAVNLFGNSQEVKTNYIHVDETNNSQDAFPQHNSILINTISEKGIFKLTPFAELSNVHIYSLTGRLLPESVYHRELQQIDLSNHQEGLYILSATTQNGSANTWLKMYKTNKIH